LIAGATNGVVGPGRHHAEGLIPAVIGQRVEY
jgi:hypothetical protein